MATPILHNAGDLWFDFCQTKYNSTANSIWVNVSVPNNGNIQFAQFGGTSPLFDFPYFMDLVISGIAITHPFGGDYLQLSSGGGVIQLDAQKITIGGIQFASISAGDPAFNRLDAVIMTAGGVLQVVTGTPSATPSIPSFSGLLIGILLVEANANSGGGVTFSRYVLDGTGGTGAALPSGLSNGEILHWNAGASIWTRNGNLRWDFNLYNYVNRFNLSVNPNDFAQIRINAGNEIRNELSNATVNRFASLFLLNQAGTHLAQLKSNNATTQQYVRLDTIAKISEIFSGTATNNCSVQLEETAGRILSKVTAGAVFSAVNHIINSWRWDVNSGNVTNFILNNIVGGIGRNEIFVSNSGTNLRSLSANYTTVSGAEAYLNVENTANSDGMRIIHNWLSDRTEISHTKGSVFYALRIESAPGNEFIRLLAQTASQAGSLTVKIGARPSVVVDCSVIESVNTPSTNRPFGISALAGGTVTVAHAGVTANSVILVTPRFASTGIMRVTAVNVGVSFTITSTSVLDNGNVSWAMFNLV